VIVVIKRLLLISLSLAALSSSPAFALKTISLGPISRSVLRDECIRAGGGTVGIGEESAVYGCIARYASVSCTPDGADCQAVVRDTIPVVGNSLRSILNLGQSANRSRAVQPVDARINSAAAAP